MSFDEFLNQARNDHAAQAEAVSMKLHGAGKLVEKNDQIPQLAQFIAHIFGEHLGKWDEGIGLLKSLTENPYFERKTESELAITRAIATLELASGQLKSVEHFTSSEQVRIIAVAAAALSGRGSAEGAQALFKLALTKAQDLSRDDPAHRALAVTSNNLALSLEEKSERSDEDKELMIFAAQAARKYWEIAGGWLEIERAEYRLAMSFMHAGDFMRALQHAHECIKISKNNPGPPIELFFGYEALAQIGKTSGNAGGFKEAVAQLKEQWEKLPPAGQKWAEPYLLKVIS